jgi:AAA domain
MTASARSSRRIRPFTPSQESVADLSDRTVGRDEILDILIDRLVSAAISRNRPHTLLVGPRGSGKTHLINVAIHRAQQLPDVRQRLRFVRFDEDAVGITRYLDILQEVLSALSPSQSGNRRPTLPSNPEEAVAEALGDQVLVLVIENLDRIFQAFGEGGQQDFRSWVENSGEVVVLATTPLLFPGVSDRALPWWGNFGISHLEELDVEQGRELLIRLARSSGDAALAEFLATDKGEARLRAINALAGGSPRIWMILFECLTVELLDELVPAVEALLEGLVPYYQQLLWDLSPVEQRLIRELADGPHQAATVAELAKAAGIEPRVAASTLGRLADIRWVRAEKVPELDKRASWYRLREPMLRHHFHYRSATDQPLPLIVEILRAWYDPAERRTELARAEAASEAERLMAAALLQETPALDFSFDNRSVDVLLAKARQWLHGGVDSPQPPEAGALIDIAILAVRQGPVTAARIAARRDPDARLVTATEAALNLISNQNSNASEQARVGELLRVLSANTSGAAHVVLELTSACWDGPGDPSLAYRRLSDLLQAAESNTHQSLQLGVLSALAYWAGAANNKTAAREHYAALASECTTALGHDHPDTSEARLLLARSASDSGDFVTALSELAALIAGFEVGGEADLLKKLNMRHLFAHLTGNAGDPTSARDQLEDLAKEFEAIDFVEAAWLARSGVAMWTGYSGDPVKACTLAAQLLLELPKHSKYQADFREFAYADLRDNLRLLVAGPQKVDDLEIPVIVAPATIVMLLQAAIAGSAEALVRLPSELVEIVEDLRAGSAVGE